MIRARKEAHDVLVHLKMTENLSKKVVITIEKKQMKEATQNR